MVTQAYNSSTWQRQRAEADKGDRSSFEAVITT